MVRRHKTVKQVNRLSVFDFIVNSPLLKMIQTSVRRIKTRHYPLFGQIQRPSWRKHRRHPNMEQIQITRSSPKGQVVIPQNIRKNMKIKSGTKFAVYGKKDVIIFKKLEMPTVEDFEKIASFGRKFAKKKGITKKDVLEDD